MPREKLREIWDKNTDLEFRDQLFDGVNRVLADVMALRASFEAVYGHENRIGDRRINIGDRRNFCGCREDECADGSLGVKKGTGSVYVDGSVIADECGHGRRSNDGSRRVKDRRGS